MAKFRKKPVVIEARQWLGIQSFPMEGVHFDAVSNDGGSRPYVITIHEQRAYLEDGDWVLPEPKEGRFYPCKPDIFAATYEPVEGD